MTPRKGNENSSHEQKLRKRDPQLITKQLQTPQPATDLPPASMLFRDGKERVFPRKLATDSDVSLAKERDK